MEFQIVVGVRDRTYTMRVVASATEREEIYVITAGRSSIELRNNLPFLRAHHIKKYPDWKQTEGTPRRQETLEAIIQAIELYYNPPPRPRPEPPIIRYERRKGGLPPVEVIVRPGT